YPASHLLLRPSFPTRRSSDLVLLAPLGELITRLRHPLRELQHRPVERTHVTITILTRPVETLHTTSHIGERGQGILAGRLDLLARLIDGLGVHALLHGVLHVVVKTLPHPPERNSAVPDRFLVPVPRLITPLW